jgi:hypothetical protein
MIEDREAIPEPSTLDQVMKDPENQGATAFLVPVKTAKSAIVRVNVTFDEQHLREIDSAAREAGMTRSAFLTEATRQRFAERAREELQSGRAAARSRQTQRALTQARGEVTTMSKSTRNTGKHWSQGEVKTLRQLAEANTPTRVIGLKLGRTEQAIRQKASQAHVSLKPTNQSPYNRRRGSR